jgi:hypothetical protein
MFAAKQKNTATTMPQIETTTRTQHNEYNEHVVTNLTPYLPRKEQFIEDIVSEDVWCNIIPYNTIETALSLSQTCQYFYNLIFNVEQTSCSAIWKQFSEIVDGENVKLFKFDSGVAIELKIENYLMYYKKYCLLRFDTSTVNPDLTKFKFTNNKRTVVNERLTTEPERWELLHANIKLTPGRVYKFEYVIENYLKLQGNGWMIAVGINSVHADYYRTNEETFGPWLTHKVDGMGIIVCTGALLHNDSQLSEYPSRKPALKNGDVIGFRVDMTNTVNESGTVIDVYLNGVIFTYKSFTSLKGDAFYPAISLMNQQSISIRSGLTLVDNLVDSL